MDNSKNNKPVRAFLWSVPRSLSTVFEKCMSFIPKTQIINEPFTCAYHVGPDKIPDPPEFMSDENREKEKEFFQEINSMEISLPMAFDSEKCSYDFIKGELEAGYPDKDFVFCKDMAYGLNGKYDMIPSGYRHTFIIRNPYRVFPSYKKMMAKAIAGFIKNPDFEFTNLPNSWVPKNYAFQEQWELFEYLKDHGEPEPIIVDADDLLQDPARIMTKYCARLGIPYSDDMLEWPAGLDVIKSWKGSKEILLGNLLSTGGYYDGALSSTKFNSPKKMPRREDLSKDLLKCVDHSMPFYEKMYSLRLN